MDAAILSKLVKTMALLDSPLHGEQTSALAAAGRLLKSADMTWGDLARHLEDAGGRHERGRRHGAAQATSKELERERRHRAEAEERAEAAQKQAEKHAKTVLRQRSQLSQIRNELTTERARGEDLERQIATLTAWVEQHRSPHAWRGEVQRLLLEGKLSLRAIARKVGVSPQSVANIRDRMNR